MSKGSILIELKFRSINFPNSCPVCGDPTTTEGTVLAMSRLQRMDAKRLARGSFPSSRVVASTGSMPDYTSLSMIRIPVCDAHEISFEDTKRFRSTMSAFSGLFIVATFLLSIVFSVSWLDTGVINTQLLTVLLLIGVGAIIAYMLSRPTALERVIEVYDMQSDMSLVVLKISNSAYAEEILSLNPMYAELVKP